METRKHEDNQTIEAYSKKKRTQKLSLRKAEIEKLIYTKRFKDFKVVSIYEINERNLKVPEQFFKVNTSSQENFSYLIELLSSDDLDVIKFVVVTLRKLTLNGIDFDGTINLRWVERIFSFICDKLNEKHFDLVVRI